MLNPGNKMKNIMNVSAAELTRSVVKFNTHVNNRVPEQRVQAGRAIRASAVFLPLLNIVAGTVSGEEPGQLILLYYM